MPKPIGREVEEKLYDPLPLPAPEYAPAPSTDPELPVKSATARIMYVKLPFVTVTVSDELVVVRTW
jgi:hypothetical protein